MSEAVMDLASLTLGQIAPNGLMLSGRDVTVHLKEEWGVRRQNKQADLYRD